MRNKLTKVKFGSDSIIWSMLPYRCCSHPETRICCTCSLPLSTTILGWEDWLWG